MCVCMRTRLVLTGWQRQCTFQGFRASEGPEVPAAVGLVDVVDEIVHSWGDRQFVLLFVFDRLELFAVVILVIFLRTDKQIYFK